MASHDYIRAAVNALLARHETRAPLVLAEAEGIHLYPRHNFHDLRGMYAKVGQWPCIFYKADLPEPQVAEIVAHELGHHCLHEEYIEAGQEFIEHSLFDPRSKLEREANFFAAELLISDADFMEALQTEESLDWLARRSGYNQDLWLYKAELMRAAGHKFSLPYSPRIDFWQRS